MAKITILGGSGFAGGWIAREAAARGHEVTTVSRSTPAELPEGVRVQLGSVLDGPTLTEALDGAEVVVGALAPRGDMEGKVADAYADVAARLEGSDVRFLIVGGFGSLKDANGERIVNTDGFAPEYRPESLELLAALERVSALEVDWTYISPAGIFGGFVPDQTRRGEYRSGGDRAIFDADGQSTISGPDFALAVVDEIEADAHRRQHISFAY